MATKTPFSKTAAADAPAVEEERDPKAEKVETIGMNPTVDPKSMGNTLGWGTPSDQNQTSGSTSTAPEPDLTTVAGVVAALKDNPGILDGYSKAEIIAMLKGAS